MEGKQERIKERLALSLPLRVQCRESADYEWLEMSRLKNVTAFGAGFTITRPTERGRLLHLTLPMPRPLRCFDHVEEQYRVWSLVRYSQPLPPTPKSSFHFLVGVAFVGKRPPASFLADPAKRYEIAATPMESNLWHVREIASDSAWITSASARCIMPRYAIPMEIVVEVFEQGQPVAKESTVTENISRKGACVYTSLKVEPGRFIRVSSAQYSITVLAVVRGKRTGADKQTRLHLEFIDREWPLEGIE